MIIEFNTSNFRSIKDEMILSFEANSSKLKADNIHLAAYASGEHRHTLIKNTAIFGHNASGKSNILKAINTLRKLVVRSYLNEIGEDISCYEPFILDTQYATKNTEFNIKFITVGVKYEFGVKYNRDRIIEEMLYVYKTKQRTLLYTRNDIDSDIHSVEFKKDLAVEGVKREVAKNQLYLSRFMSMEVHSVLSQVCLYFKNLDIELSTNASRTKFINDNIAMRILSDQSGVLKNRLLRLMTIADIPIVGISIKELEGRDLSARIRSFPRGMHNTRTEVKFRHKLYTDGELAGEGNISLEEQSLGTQVLFGLGARILSVLENGGVLIYDEFDNSLHPFLTKLLVRLFNSKKCNPQGAQLIITTHDYSIMGRDLLRTDQIWFVEKNECGGSELFSVQDFDGVREDVPFDKWYQSGKFGAIPTIGDMDYIFDGYVKEA